MTDPTIKFIDIAESCQATIDKFAADLIKDPSHTLSWGDKAFQAAARLRVAKEIIHHFAGNATVQQVREYVMDQVLHSAKYPPSSTSPTSNLMEQYTLAAYAEAVQTLEHYE